MKVRGACWVLAVVVVCLVGSRLCSAESRGDGRGEEEEVRSWAREGREGLSNVLGAVMQLRGGGEDYSWPELKLTPRLVVAVVLGAVGACLSSAGGVGGGGLYVPLFNLLLGFDAKTAAALSNFMILGGSVSNVGSNLRQLHPEVEGEPVIDFDAAMLMQPNMLLGISLGVICNVMFPSWLITALLAITLGYMTIRSLRGAVKRWANESLKLREGPCLSEKREKGDLRTPLLLSTAHGTSAGEPESAHLKEKEEGGCKGVSAAGQLFIKNEALFLSIPDINMSNPDAHMHAKCNPGDVENQSTSNPPTPRTPGTPTRPQLTKSLTMEKVFKTMGTDREEEHGLHHAPSSASLDGAPIHERFPLRKLGVLALVWFVYFAINVIRGGKSSQSLFNVKPCGLGYWLLTASQLPVALGFTVWAALEAHKSSDDSSAGDQEDHVSCGHKAGGLLPVMAFLAGLLGGMLGIGGGMIINPLLLEIGMCPQVTAATCAFMVFFSSSMSVVQYWLLGRIPMEHAILFAMICFVFSLVGQIVVQRIIIRYGRASIIIFSVSAVIGLSALAMAGFGGYEVIEQYLGGGYMGFHRPC